MKKQFGLAALSFLGGLVASTGGGACGGAVNSLPQEGGVSAGGSGTPGGSSDAAASGGEGGASGSSGTSGAVDSGSGGPPLDAGHTAVCTGTLPVSPAALLWKSPYEGPGSCSQAELDALVAFVAANPAAKYAEWKASVANATCASCIFGLASAPTWTPLLEDALGALVEQNVGGCIAIASGNDSCGRAYQNWFDCRFLACSDCPSGSAALSMCQTAASKAGGGCKTYYDAVVPACTDAVVSNAETTCAGTKYFFEGPIRAQCIGLK
jgi:hypothetical protein